MNCLLHIGSYALIFFSMKIGFAYNIKNKNPSTKLEEQDEQEYDSPEVIKMISDAIKELGHKVIPVKANGNAYEELKSVVGKVDLVFNIAEGVHADARESQVPFYCEVLKIPYTHSTPTTHAIGLDKLFTKLLLKGVGVKVPSSILVSSAEDPIGRIKFPVIIKPNSEGSSIGIMNDNVVSDKKSLKRRLEKVYASGYTGKYLVEEYIEGREFTVSILGNNPPRILPIVEQKFNFLPEGYHKIAGYELKWFLEDKLKNLKEAYDCPAKIEPELEKKIHKVCLLTYETLRVLDCARIDFRLNEKGELYLLEINTLPGLNFDEKIISYFPLAARTAGLKPKDVVGAIIDGARERWGI